MQGMSQATMLKTMSNDSVGRVARLQAGALSMWLAMKMHQWTGLMTMMMPTWQMRWAEGARVMPLTTPCLR